MLDPSQLFKQEFILLAEPNVRSEFLFLLPQRDTILTVNVKDYIPLIFIHWGEASQHIN
jgi:hypothetical protein